MSATLRVSDFAENPTLFSTPPPVLHITARQHPVTVHFARRTQHDYLAQAYKKVARIHARLPPGGVLVFCTGQNEIVSLCKRLEKKFSAKAVAARKERVKRAAAMRNGRGAAASRDDEEAEEAEVDAKLKGKVEVGDDLEAEDVELGADKDLAADVDDGVYEDDEEGLESDEDMDDEAFQGLDIEEDVDGASSLSLSLSFSEPRAHQLTFFSLQSRFTSSPCTRSSRPSARCASSPSLLRVTDSSSSRPTSPRRPSRSPTSSTSSTPVAPRR